jgi:transcriptional regulator with XRE-family HTH domain
MQLSDITKHLGITATYLAELMGTTRQALNNYTSGRKGKPSKFVIELLAVANLNREEIIFPDVFDHPDGENPDSPAYWANIAIEALAEAKKRGLDTTKIITQVKEMIEPILSDLNPEITEY